jgi:hypothetical protein
LVVEKFGEIFESNKNLTIRLEKKKWMPHKNNNICFFIMVYSHVYNPLFSNLSYRNVLFYLLESWLFDINFWVTLIYYDKIIYYKKEQQVNGFSNLKYPINNL